VAEGDGDEQMLGSPRYYCRRRPRVHYAEGPPAQMERNEQRAPVSFCQMV